MSAIMLLRHTRCISVPRVWILAVFMVLVLTFYHGADRILNCLSMRAATLLLQTEGCDGSKMLEAFVQSGVRRNEYSSLTFLLHELSDELTVVTAFFNIGNFSKGSHTNVFTPKLYHQWITSFARLNNPLVVFVDNNNDFNYFRSQRSGVLFNKTCIVEVNREHMWAFSPEMQSRIGELYRTPSYPKHYPNTVVPMYTMAMNSKYEVVQIALRYNPFNTRYFCWLDIGLFRDKTEPLPAELSPSTLPQATPATIPEKEMFRLYLPPNFEGENRTSTVAVCEIDSPDYNLKPENIIGWNVVWIGGGFFVGQIDVMFRWTFEYMAAYEWLLSNNLSSTDQQVIYSMFNAAKAGMYPKPRTRFTRYRGDGRYNPWFHLAYIAIEEGLIRQRREDGGK